MPCLEPVHAGDDEDLPRGAWGRRDPQHARELVGVEISRQHGLPGEQGCRQPNDPADRQRGDADDRSAQAVADATDAVVRTPTA